MQSNATGVLLFGEEVDPTIGILNQIEKDQKYLKEEGIDIPQLDPS